MVMVQSNRRRDGTPKRWPKIRSHVATLRPDIHPGGGRFRGSRRPVIADSNARIGGRISCRGAESTTRDVRPDIEYFKKLDAASDHMTLVEAGTSTQGRTYYFALISTPANLKKVDRYREIARRCRGPKA
jgi:hypothetical protein